eukprot:Em0002g1305a
MRVIGFSCSASTSVLGASGKCLPRALGWLSAALPAFQECTRVFCSFFDWQTCYPSLEDSCNPDWVPTANLGYTSSTPRWSDYEETLVPPIANEQHIAHPNADSNQGSDCEEILVPPNANKQHIAHSNADSDQISCSCETDSVVENEYQSAESLCQDEAKLKIYTVFHVALSDAGKAIQLDLIKSSKGTTSYLQSLIKNFQMVNQISCF